MASLLPKPEAVAAEIERLQARAKRQRERAKSLTDEAKIAKDAAAECEKTIAWLRQAPGAPSTQTPAGVQPGPAPGFEDA